MELSTVDESLLARIEFQKPIGQFTEREQTALVAQLVMAAKRIQDHQWNAIDIAEFSAPDPKDAPRVVLPG